MLASHSAISSSPEPWLLLPLLSATRRDGVYAAFSHQTSVDAIQDLWNRFPNGRADYDDELRRFITRLYRRLSDPQARYFLDKTPRYALIVDDVLDLFDQSPAIVLWRHPLAIIGSIIESWGGGRWAPYRLKVDLFDGLANLVKAYTRDPDRFVSVRYEELVLKPETTAKHLINRLGLDWEPAVVSNFNQTKLEGAMGDKSGVRTYEAVSAAPLENWKRSIASPVRKAWCRRYLHWIGDERLAMMGYDLAEIMTELDAIPTRFATAGDDAGLMMKSVLWSLAEPRVMRSKIARLPEFGRIYSHT